MVIDLPNDSLQNFFRQSLNWLDLLPDEQLVGKLHAWLVNFQKPVDVKKMSFREIDIRQTPLFLEQSVETQQAMMDAFRVEKQEILPTDTLAWMLSKKQPVGKREEKWLNKEKEAMRLKYELGMKP